MPVVAHLRPFFGLSANALCGALHPAFAVRRLAIEGMRSPSYQYQSECEAYALAYAIRRKAKGQPIAHLTQHEEV